MNDQVYHGEIRIRDRMDAWLAYIVKSGAAPFRNLLLTESCFSLALYDGTELRRVSSTGKGRKDGRKERV